MKSKFVNDKVKFFQVVRSKNWLPQSSGTYDSQTAMTFQGSGS